MKTVNYGAKSLKTKIIMGTTGILAGLIVIGTIAGFKTVQANTICVQTQWGKVVGYKSSGLTWIAPIRDKLVCTSTAQINYGRDKGYNVSTKDMQTVDMFVRVNYAVDRTKIEDLFENFQFKHEETLISPVVADVIQGVSSRYTIEELVEKREEIAGIMRDQVTARLEDNGIVVHNVNIINHEFSDAYEASVEAKKVAEQNVLKAEQELLEAKIQAEKNKTIAQTFTNELANKLMLEKWDGKLPQYYGGDNGPFSVFITEDKAK